MIAEELINQMIPALKVSDTAEKAIIWMEEFKLEQLPVIEQSRFKGLISEELILESNNLDQPISDFLLFGESCFVTGSQHFFDILKAAIEQNAKLIAVINDEGEYIGVSSYEDALNEFARTVTIQSTGGIIVLSLRTVDYSLTEISRIIESDNIKILGTYVSSPYPDSDKIFLTLKLNTNEITSVLASLDRFDYNVVAKFQNIESFEHNKDRIDHLMRFLDI